jgi:hypothetical protein
MAAADARCEDRYSFVFSAVLLGLGVRHPDGDCVSGDLLDGFDDHLVHPLHSGDVRHPRRNPPTALQHDRRLTPRIAG